MKQFMLFLRRVWAGLKAVCIRKTNTVTIHSSEDTLVSKDLADVLKNIRLEAKSIARQRLSGTPRVSRNHYREILEREAQSIFERILGTAGDSNLCLA